MSKITIESPPLLFDVIDHGINIPMLRAGKSHSSNGKASGKKKPQVAEQDRRRLKELEIFLNNCMNVANGLEDKRAAKILRLLREARDQAIRLRG